MSRFIFSLTNSIWCPDYNPRKDALRILLRFKILLITKARNRGSSTCTWDQISHETPAPPTANLKELWWDPTPRGPIQCVFTLKSLNSTLEDATNTIRMIQTIRSASLTCRPGLQRRQTRLKSGEPPQLEHCKRAHSFHFISWWSRILRKQADIAFSLPGWSITG